MRLRTLPAIVASAALLVAAPALADGKADAKKTDTKQADKADAKKTDAAPSAVRKDPEGKTGISPYKEQIAKGENAFVTGDAAGAATAFQEATRMDGAQALAYYRLGEALRAQNKLDEADTALKSALDKKSTEDLHAKVLFVIADLRERQGKWKEAKDAWAAYAAFVKDAPKAHGYPATAADRDKMIDRRVKDEETYGVVKARIEKRKQEVEKEAEENAKKDKLNR